MAVRKTQSKQYEAEKRNAFRSRIDSLIFLIVMDICFVTAIYTLLSAFGGAR